MKQIALLGATASNKSSLSIKIAKKYNCIIISLDSVSVYKKINIASAKISKKKLKKIKHFGINEVSIKKNFNVCSFAKIYLKARTYAKKHNKNILFCGGSSFYLKALISGACDNFNNYNKNNKNNKNKKSQISKKLNKIMKDKNKAFNFLNMLDNKYCKKITKNDTYRISRGLEIYFTHRVTPTKFYENIKNITNNNENTNSKKISFYLKNLKIYILNTTLNEVSKNIQTRTAKMLECGLLDEACKLENKYSKKHKAMNVIGIKECLEYFDGIINTKKDLLDLIILNTRHLAKRQITFNKTQFSNTKYNQKPIFINIDNALNVFKSVF